MGDESTFSYTRKDPRGDLFTVRGYSWEEFTGNLDRAYPGQTGAILQSFGAVSAQAPGAAFPSQPPAQTPAPAATPDQAPAVSTQTASQVTGQTCPQCGVGQVVPKQRKDGSGVFFGCNNYPACKYIRRS